MKRTLILTALALAAMATPELHAQRAGKGRPGCTPTCEGQQLRKRDGSCPTPGQGKGMGQRKQDGTGPRGGTDACPKTPKTEPKK